METASVPALLARSKEQGLITEPMKTTYYLGRERLIPDANSKQRLAGWRKQLFIFMSRNSRSATEFFQIPPNRVVELGAQIVF